MLSDPFVPPYWPIEPRLTQYCVPRQHLGPNIRHDPAQGKNTLPTSMPLFNSPSANVIAIAISATRPPGTLLETVTEVLNNTQMHPRKRGKQSGCRPVPPWCFAPARQEGPT